MIIGCSASKSSKNTNQKRYPTNFEIRANAKTASYRLMRSHTAYTTTEQIRTHRRAHPAGIAGQLQRSQTLEPRGLEAFLIVNLVYPWKKMVRYHVLRRAGTQVPEVIFCKMPSRIAWITPKEGHLSPLNRSHITPTKIKPKTSSQQNSAIEKKQYFNVPPTKTERKMMSQQNLAPIETEMEMPTKHPLTKTAPRTLKTGNHSQPISQITSGYGIFNPSTTSVGGITTSLKLHAQRSYELEASPPRSKNINTSKSDDSPKGLSIH